MRSPDWNRLDPELVAMIKRALDADFDAFAQTCEDTGLLRQKFLALNDTARGTFKQPDHRFCLSMCASAVVSAANHYGGQGELDVAERLAQWALQLEPSHVPALVCLRTIAEVRGDRRAVGAHQKAADAILQRIRSTPEKSLSAFECGILNVT